MAYPVLAEQSTWFAPNVSTVKRANITEVEIMDSYSPDSSVTVVDSWDASAAKDGSITCYVIGTKLIIAGNGSGKIVLSESAKYTFYDSVNWSDPFSNVTSISGADLFDFSSVNEAHGFFYECNKLASVDVSEWDVSNVSTVHSMFQNCRELQSVDLSKWNFTKLMSFKQMFYGCNKITSVGDLSNWNIDCKNMEAMFQDCFMLSSVLLGEMDFHPNNENTFRYMFKGCQALKTFIIKKANMHSKTKTTEMFIGCTCLQNVNDMRFIDFSKITDMSFMFYDCSSLGEIDVSNWDVSNVTNFDHFAAHANLKRKGIENWKTTSAINMNALFHNCAEEELDLSGWDVSKVQFFCQMFENSPNLKRIKGLEKWNTSAGLGFDGMFERCSKLEEVDLSSFDTTKAKNNVAASTNGHKTATLQNMFLSCDNLRKVTLGSKFTINGDGTNTTAANKLILPTPSTEYLEGANGKWYDFGGMEYAPNAIPDRAAETYYAVYDDVGDVDMTIKNDTLIQVARAIRTKNGGTERYKPSEFAAAIEALS